ncbi:unnamed protein product [Heligmosomoides polygyrus]|uniref:SCP domain-containing protein n=1 Tax=Heligmosomoides polygyrus TaxID=6339 RepID=A0A183G0M8_HELPZ|nr:unnamed protein product [Heligmosomoides polygyrus]
MHYVILLLIVPTLVLPLTGPPPFTCTGINSHEKTYNRGQRLDAVHSRLLQEIHNAHLHERVNPNQNPFGSANTPINRLPTFTLTSNEIRLQLNPPSGQFSDVKRLVASDHNANEVASTSYLIAHEANSAHRAYGLITDNGFNEMLNFCRSLPQGDASRRG